MAWAQPSLVWVRGADAGASRIAETDIVSVLAAVESPLRVINEVEYARIAKELGCSRNHFGKSECFKIVAARLGADLVLVIESSRRLFRKDQREQDQLFGKFTLYRREQTRLLFARRFILEEGKISESVRHEVGENLSTIVSQWSGGNAVADSASTPTVPTGSQASQSVPMEQTASQSRSELSVASKPGEVFEVDGRSPELASGGDGDRSDDFPLDAKEETVNGDEEAPSSSDSEANPEDFDSGVFRHFQFEKSRGLVFEFGMASFLRQGALVEGDVPFVHKFGYQDSVGFEKSRVGLKLGFSFYPLRWWQPTAWWAQFGLKVRANMYGQKVEQEGHLGLTVEGRLVTDIRAGLLWEEVLTDSALSQVRVGLMYGSLNFPGGRGFPDIGYRFMELKGGITMILSEDFDCGVNLGLMYPHRVSGQVETLGNPRSNFFFGYEFGTRLAYSLPWLDAVAMSGFVDVDYQSLRLKYEGLGEYDSTPVVGADIRDDTWSLAMGLRVVF